MRLKQTPDIARFFLLWAAFVLALPGALSLYSRYQGRVLVALPLMETTPVLMMRIDRREVVPKLDVTFSKPPELFAQSVIYVAQHDGWGAFGLILNKPLPEDELKKMPLERQGFDWRIGGPTGFADSAFVLVTQDSPKAAPAIMSLHDYTQEYPEEWTEILSTPEKRRSFTIYLGFLNWGSLHLDREFRWGLWDQTDFSSSMLDPQEDPAELWRKALRKVLEKSPPTMGKI